MKIILTAMDDALADAWLQHCGHFDNVQVHRGSIFDIHCDAVVSPANSFGFMDGGIDLAYSEYFGWDLQDRLQTAIRKHHHGELLVGTAEIVETGNGTTPYLLAAPTMRVPMILTDSVNPYLAARAVFLLIRNGNFRAGQKDTGPIRSRISTIAFPGLGTGAGNIEPAVCAKQMAAAILACPKEAPSFPGSWLEASKDHQLLYTDRAHDLQMGSEDL